MTAYIGIDGHAQTSTLVPLRPSGKRMQTQVVPTTDAELVAAVRAIPGPRFICLEEGTLSEWLYELLTPHAEQVVVTVLPKRRGPKNDERDALELAERLRRHAVETQIFKAPNQCGELRTAVRAHVWLTRDVTRIKCRLRALGLSRGLHAGDAFYKPTERETWLPRLPARLRPLCQLLGAEHDALAPLQQQAEKALLAEARKHAAIRLLQTIPGFGPIRSAQFVAVVVTPTRFRSKRQFWSYAGLGIVTSASSEWALHDGKLQRQAVVQTRGLNRNRHPLLKNVLKGAAHTIVTQLPEHPLAQQFRRQVENGTKPNLALLTLARRLAAVALHVWKHQEVYDLAKHCPAKVE